MDKVSLLSREQLIKKCFIQLGKKFSVSPDIVKLLYKYTKKGETEEMMKTRSFYINIFNIMHRRRFGQYLAHVKTHTKLMLAINIIGEERFLISSTKYKNHPPLDPQGLFMGHLCDERDIYCSLREKILYLNTVPYKEIKYCYEEYLNYNEFMSGWGVVFNPLLVICPGT